MHVWRRATLTFGMVNIPVGVSGATKEHKHTQLHGAHIKCGQPVKQHSRCDVCGCDLSQDEIKLVYDVTSKQTIDIPKEEWEKLGLSASSIIQIDKTFPLQQLEPELIRKSYYLVPNKDFRTQYGLFAQALATTKLAAKGTSVLGGKEYPAAVRAEHGVLTLNLMWCADEIVQPDSDFDILEQKLNPQEVALAKDIMRSMSGTLDATDLQSVTWEAQKRFIQSRIDNGEFSPVEQIAEPNATTDMMAALRDTMKQVQKQKTVSRKAAPPRRRPPKKVTA